MIHLLLSKKDFSISRSFDPGPVGFSDVIPQNVKVQLFDSFRVTGAPKWLFYRIPCVVKPPNRHKNQLSSPSRTLCVEFRNVALLPWKRKNWPIAFQGTSHCQNSKLMPENDSPSPKTINRVKISSLYPSYIIFFEFFNYGGLVLQGLGLAPNQKILESISQDLKDTQTWNLD